MKNITYIVAAMFCLVFSSVAVSMDTMTPEEAEKIKFSNVCSKQYWVDVEFDNATGSKTWTGAAGTPEAVTNLIAITKQQCLTNEAKAKQSLLKLKANWYAVCQSEGCNPSAHQPSQSNCHLGEFTVFNRADTNFFCVYQVQNGYPQKPLGPGERCYDGKGGAPGYSKATCSIPASEFKPSLYVGLYCLQPGEESTHDLDLYNMDRDDSDTDRIPPGEEGPINDGEVPIR